MVRSSPGKSILQLYLDIPKTSNPPCPSQNPILYLSGSSSQLKRWLVTQLPHQKPQHYHHLLSVPQCLSASSKSWPLGVSSVLMSPSIAISSIQSTFLLHLSIWLTPCPHEVPALSNQFCLNTAHDKSLSYCLFLITLITPHIYCMEPKVQSKV